MKLSVLIVEDTLHILNQLALLINSLSQQQKDEAGIESVTTDKASSISEAESFLIAASESRKPYDILMLDLSLPQHPDETDNVRGGLDLLSKAHKLQAVRKTIIVSGNFDLESHVSESFNRGAISFIRKPYPNVEVQRQLLNAVGLLNEQYQFKHRKLVDERIPVLSASIWRSANFEVRSRVYDLIQTFAYKSEEMRRELQDRFGITDAEDSLLHHLTEIDSAIETSREGLADLLKGLENNSNNGNEAEEFILNEELLALAESLKPCLEISFSSELTEKFVALSFQQNVQTVLKEILIGGLSEQSDSTRTWQAEIEITSDESMISVNINDDFPPLPVEVAERISKGEHFSLKGVSTRQWGLSLAQHIALRGGGRLIVIPMSNGNQITYLIPRA